MLQNRKIIMDCDPGHDDAIALILAGAQSSPLNIFSSDNCCGKSISR